MSVVVHFRFIMVVVVTVVVAPHGDWGSAWASGFGLRFTTVVVEGAGLQVRESVLDAWRLLMFLVVPLLRLDCDFAGGGMRTLGL